MFGLPPGAGPGPAVDRPALREAGRVSSPAFRIGVAVPSATWIPGRTRRPVRGVGGLWIGDASRYPPPATQSDPRRHTIMLLPSRQAVTSGLNASDAPQ